MSSTPEPCRCAGFESSEDDEDVCTCGHNYDVHSGSGECQAGHPFEAAAARPKSS